MLMTLSNGPPTETDLILHMSKIEVHIIYSFVIAHRRKINKGAELHKGHIRKGSKEPSRRRMYKKEEKRLYRRIRIQETMHGGTRHGVSNWDTLKLERDCSESTTVTRHRDRFFSAGREAV